VPPPPTAAAGAGRAARLAVDAAEAVVFEDQREDAVVARPRDPRPLRGRRERHQRRPRPADERHRCTAREQLAHRSQPAARGDEQIRKRDRRNDDERDEHLRLKAKAGAHAGQHQPARPAVLERAHRAPQRRDAAQNEERVGIVVA